VKAKNKYVSLYKPILFCMKDEKKYTFNSEAILVDAKTGSKEN
jgi:site-specific DNA-methyltransferase (adenine-specific)